MAEVYGIEELRDRLLSGESSVASRMRTVFALKGINTDESVETLGSALKSETSALVLHEICYVLGQMQRVSALPILINTLKNTHYEPMVRHEAAEAIAAIGHPDGLPILMEYQNDSALEVAETCQIAVLQLHQRLNNSNKSINDSSQHGFSSVDPAPPSESRDVDSLRKQILDATNYSLFERYKAMFSLRNIGNDESVDVLCDALDADSSSALFRHEVAFVLGQMQNARSIPALQRCLENDSEHDMVRHEAAEALGAIATSTCDTILQTFCNDPTPVVRESCAVALDISDYFNSESLHYTDTIPKATTTTSAQ
mmetsp:Transcript_1414/g.2570  ORF Transcript_1414/g.2570 Transcript_1414/m.2570 type:complete len:313 (-) Transcript_1414:648-1586(-)